MTYVEIEPDDDLVSVVVAITERGLIRRGLADRIALFDDPMSVVQLERDDADHIRVLLNDELVNVLPPDAIRAGLEMLRAARAAGVASRD